MTKNCPNRQIKTKQRVRDHGEVFTAQREVDNILDLTANAHRNYKDQRVLEPACGTGNFLVTILDRRLKDIECSIKKKDQAGFEFALLTALSTLYGVDIMLDNVHECRNRLKEKILTAYNKRVTKNKRQDVFTSAIDVILNTNIQCGDMLNGKDKITFIEYTSPRDNYFICQRFALTDMEADIEKVITRWPPRPWQELVSNQGLYA